MSKLQKKMTIKDYDTKVPANVKQDNNEKMAAYELEFKENEASKKDLERFQV